MDILETMLEMASKPLFPDYRRSDSVYPSEASCIVDNIWGEPEVVGKCLRAVVYRMKGTGGESSSSNNLLQREGGEGIHDRIYKLAMKAGLYIASEISLYMPGVNMSGRIDMVMHHPSSGEPIGVEIKTTHSHMGRKGVIEDTAGVKISPKLEHVCQVVPYMKAMAGKIRQWQIWYISRDTGAHRAHTVLLDEHGIASVNGERTKISWDGIKKRFSAAMECYESNVLPPQEFSLKWSKERLQLMYSRGLMNKAQAKEYEKDGTLDTGDWQCGYCDYAATCWGME